MQCCAMLCNAVQCCAMLCNAVLCCAMLCYAVLCCPMLCCALLCSAVLCCAVLCCAVLCCAVLCCACRGAQIDVESFQLDLAFGGACVMRAAYGREGERGAWRAPRRWLSGQRSEAKTSGEKKRRRRQSVLAISPRAPSRAPHLPNLAARTLRSAAGTHLPCCST